MTDLQSRPLWDSSMYAIDATNPEADTPESIVERVYLQSCRTSFEQPGFTLIDLGRDYGSKPMRQFMVDLKRELDRIHLRRTGKHLVYRSMGRFDQQVTTRAHRDNGPNESLLMLGYEPTAVRASVTLSDYSRSAATLGLSPVEFLDQHNPMFNPDAANLLADFQTPIDGFDNESHQILVINNSQAAPDPAIGSLLGVLHTADVPDPDPSQQRVVNSTMIVVAERSEDESVSAEEIISFLTTGDVKTRY